MQFFLMGVMVIFITIYTGLFGYSVYKTNNKKGTAAVICVILLVIISPFLLYRF
ncbi:hypothetical protein SFC66_05595 [Terribacillus saccharophilus]|uniref:hypothetical protein n=1 Tax=Terribacillus saccharophilus TaxID=361277 RepID=UPI003981B9A6